MQEIKNIVFDYGCVLVDLDKQRAVDAFKRIDADEIAVYIDECKQEDLFHELEMGDITLEEFCDKVREKCPRCKASDKEILDAWNALLTGIPERRLERIRQLREHYRLCHAHHKAQQGHLPAHARRGRHTCRRDAVH